VSTARISLPDRYRVVRHIANGGMASVWEAHDEKLDRAVAVKLIRSEHWASPDARERFEERMRHEARASARVSHPNIVAIIDTIEDGDGLALVFPYIAGETLAKRLARTPRLEPRQAAAIALDIADALAAAHAQGILHRDVKPQNIYLKANGQPLLLDFGAARRVIGDMTQALTVILKPGYAPVEQYADTASLRQGPWTDIYALAAVVHLAITGSSPEPSVARMVADPYRPLAERARGRYSTAFLVGVDRALQVLPQARPQSVSEFAGLLGIDLRDDATRRQDGTGVVSAKGNEAGKLKRISTVFAACGVATALIVAGGYALKHEARDDFPTAVPEVAPAPLYAPSRPPDVPLLQKPPMIAAPAVEAPAAESSGSEPHAAAAASDSAHRAQVRSKASQIAPKSKPVPEPDTLRRARATRSAVARSTESRAPRDAANESRTPKGGVTTIECGDILHRISLGVSLPGDQQLMREKCR